VVVQSGKTINFTVIGPHNLILPNYYWKNYGDKRYSVRLNQRRLIFSDLTNRKEIGCDYEGPIKLILASNTGYLEGPEGNYAGNFSIELEGMELRLICRLDLETYLAGVLWGELGRVGEDLLEAAKAQAVISRTYYIHWALRQPSRTLIPPGTSFQVYRYHPDYPKVIRTAVRQTHHQILIRDNKPIQAFFSADCGGHRAAVSEVWIGSTNGYALQDAGWDGTDLNSEFCIMNRSHFWNHSISKAELQQCCQTQLFKSGNETLSDFSIHSRSKSGRVDSLRIASGSASYFLVRESIRTFFKRSSLPDGLPSRLFNLYARSSENPRDTVYEFYGIGKGHGVGLCQTGAMEMARQGYHYREILQFYFKQAEIGSLSKLER